MATQDTCCSIVPYFNIHAGKLESFKNLCVQFIDITLKQRDCYYYGFSFNGDQAHCREGYANAEALLAHIDQVGAVLGEALKISDLARLEIHGPEKELAKIRGPLSELNAEYFTLEYGFRR